MKILHLLFIILLVISCQAKFNSHINQKDLPIKKCKTKDSSSAESIEANKNSYSYEWQAFKGIVFNRDVNPFAKLGKSFSDHAAKRKEKAEKKKTKNSSEPQSENKKDGADSKEVSADENNAKIKNIEK